MNEDHERIEELLAGYSLGSLDGPDLAEMERLLAEHVPTCARCRGTLSDFHAVAGELSLAAPPAEPPELLLPRLRAGIAAEPSGRRQWPGRSVPKWLSTAATVAVLALAGWNTVLNARLGDVRDTEATLADAVAFINSPGSKTVDLSNARRAPSRMLIAYRPKEQRVYLFGTHVPSPAPGYVYELWLGKGDRWTRIKDFAPTDGIVAFLLTFDANRYDEIRITEEPEGSVAGDEPARGSGRWGGSIQPARPAA